MLGIAIGLGLLAGCGKKDEPITKAEKKDTDKPGIAETKAITEEGWLCVSIGQKTKDKECNWLPAPKGPFMP